jgi:hypothetical protein
MEAKKETSTMQVTSTNVIELLNYTASHTKRLLFSLIIVHNVEIAQPSLPTCFLADTGDGSGMFLQNDVLFQITWHYN